MAATGRFFLARACVRFQNGHIENCQQIASPLPNEMGGQFFAGLQLHNSVAKNANRVRDVNYLNSGVRRWIFHQFLIYFELLPNPEVSSVVISPSLRVCALLSCSQFVFLRRLG